MSPGRRPSAPARQAEALVYAYGAIVAAGRPAVGHDWPRLPGGGRPRTLAIGPRLWLLVADVPAATFGGEALHARLTDLDWLAACGTAHHEAIVRAGRRSVCVPFRLLTLFRTDARATDEAARLRPRIERIARDIAGCREWVVRAAADPRATVPAPAPRPNSGTEYLLRRAAVRAGPARPSRAASALARKLAAALAARATRTRRRAADGGVLLDLALLVPRRREREVAALVRRSAPEFEAAGCRVWQTGPWPPYSFVSLGSSTARTRRRG